VVREGTRTSTESAIDGVRVNLITYIPPSKDFGPPSEKWSIIGVEGANYIYSFEKKCICLKVKYASPL
jgi:hypothetical protein